MSIAAAATIAVALVAGALTFPAALEPGRSERDGITLEATIGGSDWFAGSAETVIRPAKPDGLLIESRRYGRLLVSRGLAIEPERCYTAQLEARAQNEGVRLAVLTENLDDRIAMVGVPVSRQPIVHELRFEADGRRRVSVVVRGWQNSQVSVVRLVLAPRPC